MVKEIVIHLGDCKTGTTSIQEALRGGGWTGTQTKLQYPTRAHHGFAARSINRRRGSGNPDKAFRQIQKRIDKLDADTEIAVLSSEKFEYSDPELLSHYLQTHLPEFYDRIRLITYIRPHAPRLLSSFSTRVKLGRFNGEVSEFHDWLLSRGTLHYYPRLEHWQKVFGSRFEVRPMIRDLLFRKCVVHDFLNYTFDGADIALAQTPFSNESQSLEDLVMLREFHRVARSKGRVKETGIFIGRHLARLLAEHRPTGHSKLWLDRGITESIAEAYRSDARKCDEAFFSGTPLSDALESSVATAPDQPMSLRAEDHFGESELRTIQVWAEMVTKMSKISSDGWSTLFSEDQLPTESDIDD